MAYIAIIQQGMVLDTQAVAIEKDQTVAQKRAEEAAAAANAKLQGESEGYVATVVEY